eukprot:Opistho-2@33940
MKLSIVIPSYNEAKTIHLILDKVRALQLVNDIEKEVIVVNDCSTDDTNTEIEKYINQHNFPISYHSHAVNQGKGAAIRTGIQKATGDLIIIQDADLEYDPNEYNIMLMPIINGHADVVYGSRFASGRAHRILFF